MKKFIVSIGIILAVLIAALAAFGQNANNANQTQQQNIRQRFQNMSPEQRQKLREEMLQKRQQRENMSVEERQKLRSEMRERLNSRPEAMGYEQQLSSIKVIQEQVAKLKAAVEATAPENRKQMRDLPPEERTKLREKMTAAMRERQRSIIAIEQELAKFRAPARPVTDPRLRISELQSIHALAVKEKATQTAARLERFIARYEREFQGRIRTPMRGPLEGEPRQRMERPARPEKTE
jgi:hypothetical protein